jgi:Spy/CpxP family protein refolding chaperone
MTRWRSAALVGVLASLVALAAYWLIGARASEGARSAARGGTPIFDGVELSALQRTRVRLIQGRYAPELQGHIDRLRPTVRALNEARSRGDTAVARRLWAESEGDRQASKRISAQMRADIREVLTPEQRVRFDANVAAQERKAEDLDRRLSSPSDGPVPAGGPGDSAS